MFCYVNGLILLILNIDLKFLVYGFWILDFGLWFSRVEVDEIASALCASQ